MIATMLAASKIATIEALQGKVKVKRADSILKVKASAGMEIAQGDMVITSAHSSAKIALEDNSTIIVDEDAILSFVSQSEIAQKEGRVYYKITHKKAHNKLQIKTDFAIIGIKGTTFIVKSSQDKEVLLQEGVVGVQSIKEAFELYRAQVNAEFEAYKSKQQKGFEVYKYSHQTPIITDSFELQHNNKVRFDGNKVQEESFGEDENHEFAYFKQLSDAL